MHNFQINGVITPEARALTFPQVAETEIALDYFSDKLKIEVTIRSGRFVANCYTERVSWDDFQTILGYVQDFMSVQMYLVSLGYGILFGFIPCTVSYNGGADQEIIGSLGNLSAKFHLLTADSSGTIDLKSFFELHRIAWTEPGLIIAIRDFQLALANPSQRSTACARSIEALRNSMFGRDPSEAERTPAWDLFRQNLALSRGFIDACTSASRLHRHGSSTPVLPPVDTLVLERTTMIFSRFFSFRLQGNRPLSGPKFPEL